MIVGSQKNISNLKKNLKRLANIGQVSEQRKISYTYGALVGTQMLENSHLLNQLAGSDVYVADHYSPLHHPKGGLSNGLLLTDTVGFIQKYTTDSSIGATLEK